MSTRGGKAKPIVGVDAVVELTPTAGGSAITLKNMKWSLEPDAPLYTAPNTSDGMLRAAGITDYEGDLEGSTDATNTSTAIEALAMPGQIWDFKLYRSKGASTFFAGTLITGKLSVSTGTDQVEAWKLHFAKAYGDLVLPNNANF
jgi:hypothetical protein